MKGMDIKKIALYVALFIVGMMLWDHWQIEHPSVVPTVTASTDAAATTSSTAVEPVSIGSSRTTGTGSIVTVTTDTLQVKIDTLGGRLIEATLPQYPVALKSPQPVVLFNANQDSYYQAQSGLTSITTGETPFVAKQTQYQLKPGDKILVVALTYQSPNGVKVLKTFTFEPKSYAVRIGYQVFNQSGSVWRGHFYMQTERVGNSPDPSHYLGGAKGFFGVALSSPDEPYQKFTFGKLDDHEIRQSITGGWFAFMQQYFLTVWVPDASVPYDYFSKADNGLYTLGMVGPEIQLAPGQQTTVQSTLYIGPEIASNLVALSPHLNLTVDYGWLWFISVLLFWLLKHIHAIFGNWGWSIIVLTILIKALFYKLSEASGKSMAKMRLLQPKIQALKESLGGDKQAFGKATMELYRKEKVNPLGGCLPMIIQIPVFIALYYVLANSVELRQAPFIWWIHDLSAKDPYYILPVIMGLTMFLQQKLSPAPPDPTQAKMMMLLPVFMTVFLASFPSGLVLYWTVNNAVTILQQWYIMRKFAKQPQPRKLPRKK